jgi:hypothetical protein
MGSVATKKTPHFIHHPDDLKDPKAREKLVHEVTDSIVEMVNAERKRMGKAPLKK